MYAIRSYYVYFILSGSVGIDVNGRQVAIRMTGNSVGEMSALDPMIPRAATVFALEPTVVAKVSEPKISELANQFPIIYRLLLKNSRAGCTSETLSSTKNAIGFVSSSSRLSSPYPLFVRWKTTLSTTNFYLSCGPTESSRSQITPCKASKIS